MVRDMANERAPYELLALLRGEETGVRLIGRYRSYEEALRARDEDVLDQLGAGGGWYTLVEHVIVGPGLRGPRTVHPHATALGVDPAAGRIPTPDDLDDARRWLETIHQGGPGPRVSRWSSTSANAAYGMINRVLHTCLSRYGGQPALSAGAAPPPYERLASGLTADTERAGDGHPAQPFRDELVDDVLDPPVDEPSPGGQPPEFLEGSGRGVSQYLLSLGPPLLLGGPLSSDPLPAALSHRWPPGAHSMARR